MDKSNSTYQIKCLPAINFVQKIGVYESKNVSIPIIILLYSFFNLSFLSSE